MTATTGLYCVETWDHGRTQWLPATASLARIGSWRDAVREAAEVWAGGDRSVRVVEFNADGDPVVKAAFCKGHPPTEEDAIAFLRRTADAEGFGGGADRVGRVPCSTYRAVARMMLAFRDAAWETRSCLSCGRPSTGLYAGRSDFPTCGDPRCELSMQGGIDAHEHGANR